MNVLGTHFDPSEWLFINAGEEHDADYLVLLLSVTKMI